MSRREDIDNAIWSDPNFEELGPHAKLVYLWSFTNQRCGMAGIYKLPPRAAALETGLNPDDFTAALAELAERRFVFYEDEVLWVRSRVRHLRTRTPQIAKSIANDLAKLGSDHPLKAKFVSEYGGDPWLQLRPSATLGDPHPNSHSKAKSGEPHGGSATLQGKGKGKGRGIGVAVSGYTRAMLERRTWAIEHVPDLPPDFVATVLGSFAGPWEPDRVRAAVLAAYPSLAEDVS